MVFRIPVELTGGGTDQPDFHNVAIRLDKRTAVRESDKPTVRCKNGSYGVSLVVRTQSAELPRRMEDRQNVDLFIVLIHPVDGWIGAM